MRKVWLFFCVVFLLGLTLASVIRYILLQKENSCLNNNFEQIKVQIDAFEVERLNLLQTMEKQNQDNSALKDNLQVSEDKLAKVEADLARIQKATEELNAQFSTIKAENDALKKERDALEIQLTQLTLEKEGLQAKLKSISELKKLIKELKSETRQAATHLDSAKVETRMALEGNRGFFIKNGRPTYPAKVKIEVNPAP